MGTQLDATLNQTMRNYLDNFFSSLQQGGASLGSFLGSLSSFSETVRTQHTRLEHTETLVAIHRFASLIDSVSSGVMQLEKESEKIRLEMVTEVSTLLDEKMDKLTISDERKRSNTDSTKSISPYIKPSFEWLLLNLNNPYPSKEWRKRMAQETNCSIKDIDAWFTDIRKRIGWNKLRKSQFGNKQEKIIAAANHFFKASPRSFTDDLTVDLISELEPVDYSRYFTAMQFEAQRLYSTRFPDLSQSCMSDDYLSKPTTQSLQTLTEKETQNAEFLRDLNTASSYPTPEPSPEPSPEQSPLNRIPLDSFPSNLRKRRQSDLTATSIDSVEEDRPVKRLRMNRTPSVESKSDAPSASDVVYSRPILNSTPCEASVIQIPTIIGAPCSVLCMTRKRRLSDGEGQGPSKRPNNSTCLPPFRVTSDPLPSTKSHLETLFDGWVEGEHHLSDNIPSPANSENPISLAVPVTVDLHQYQFSPYNPGLYLPVTSTDSGFGNAGLPAGPSLPVDPSLVFESLPFVDSLEGLHSIDPANVQFDLVPSPTYRLDFQPDQLDISEDFSFFQSSELLSLVPGYAHDPPPFFGESCSDGSAPVAYTKAQILGNLNHFPQKGIHAPGEQDAKRARVQALREELALYEAEGL